MHTHKGDGEMLKIYPAIFIAEEDGGYSVTFPEFNGGTQGDTLEEAMDNAHIFLASFLGYYIDEEIDLPKRSDIHSINLDGEKDCIALIRVDPSPYIRGEATVETSVVISEWLAAKAEKDGLDLSTILTEALADKYC